MITSLSSLSSSVARRNEYLINDLHEFKYFGHGVNNIASAPRGACKCNFPLFKEIMTDQPTDRQTDRPGHREVSLPIRNQLAISKRTKIK